MRLLWRDCLPLRSWTQDGVRHYPVCTGSSNMSSNSKIEDYVMTNDAGAYDHYASWIADVMRPLPDA